MPLTADGYATFLGGRAVDEAFDVANDHDGNAYVVGWTWSFDFPSVPGFTTLRGRSDGFVIKLDGDGMIVYATFLGGSLDYDGASSVAVNSTGEAYITGWTSSPDFPTNHAYQPVRQGPVNAFVAKLNESGADLIYSTYLGGQSEDSGHGIAVDPLGYAYVTGVTHSTSFPTTPGVLSRGPVLIEDGFVAKFTPDGDLKYSTLLGGRGCFPTGIALGGEGYHGGSADAFVTGRAPGSIRGTPTLPPRGGLDAFVLRLDSGGTSLRYLSYIGGRFDDVAEGIAVDRNDNAYITGWAESDDFVTTDGARLHFAFSPFGGLIHHAFVARFDPDGTLYYSVLLQGSDDDWGRDVAIDNSGNAFVTGGTFSIDFPTTPDALPRPPDDACTFIGMLDQTGHLGYCTFFGGGQGRGIALDETGNVYVGGQATSVTDFFPVGTRGRRFAGGAWDAFVAKVRWRQD